MGVVGSVHQQPDADARAEMYVPYDQFPDEFTRRMYSTVSVVVRSGGNPAPLASAVREAVRQMDGTQRWPTSAFGVRLALGASAGDVMTLVLRQGLTLALAGVGIGLVASIAAVRALRTVLFDVGPWDPAAWLGSAGTLLTVAVLASWVPARRALNVNLVIALRK